MLWWTLRKIKSKEPEERRRAAEKLGRSNDPRAFQALVAALTDSETIVRQEAAKSLGGIGDPRAVEPLVVALKDKNDGVRKCAAWALGEIGDPRAIEPLVVALTDYSRIVILLEPRSTNSADGYLVCPGIENEEARKEVESALNKIDSTWVLAAIPFLIAKIKTGRFEAGAVARAIESALRSNIRSISTEDLRDVANL